MLIIHTRFFQGCVFKTQWTDSLSTIEKRQALERNTKLVHSPVLRRRQRYIGAYYQRKYIKFDNIYCKKANQGIKRKSRWPYTLDVLSFLCQKKLYWVIRIRTQGTTSKLFFRSGRILRDKDEGSYDVERSAQRSLARLGNTEARVGAENSLRGVVQSILAGSCVCGEREINQGCGEYIIRALLQQEYLIAWAIIHQALWLYPLIVL